MKQKLGITVDGVRSNRSADMSMFRPLTPTERAVMLRSVDRVYETFTGIVAEGRNLPIEKVLEIAGGRVWSGADALGIGLIDSYGGLKSAIAVAVDKAGLGEEYRIEEVREAPHGWRPSSPPSTRGSRPTSNIRSCSASTTNTATSAKRSRSRVC